MIGDIGLKLLRKPEIYIHCKHRTAISWSDHRKIKTIINATKIAPYYYRHITWGNNSMLKRTD